MVHVILHGAWILEKESVKQCHIQKRCLFDTRCIFQKFFYFL